MKNVIPDIRNTYDLDSFNFDENIGEKVICEEFEQNWQELISTEVC